MIAKHIPMNAAKKSGFARLVRYLTDTQHKEERTGAVRITNCVADFLELATLEVLNTQAMNTRSTADKTYHLLVSLRAGEELGAATFAVIEERICNGLGFTGHQRVSVVHHDTDNLHLHIAINKIDPARYTIHEPFHAYRTLARLCDKFENEYSLQKDNHEPRQEGAENRAVALERHGGIESLLGWVKRECKEQMLAAQSWEQLHAVLAAHSLDLRPRANGLVITAGDGTTIKASSVGREFSGPRLEQRMGPFRAAPEQKASRKPARRYEKRPLASGVDTTELYARYQAEQAAAGASRARECEQARARKERRLEAAKRSVRLRRAALKLAAMPVPAKKLMYKALASALRGEIAAIKSLYRRECETVSQQHRRRQWADWLRHQAGMGDLEALTVLRGRKQACGQAGNILHGNGPAQGPARPSGHDSVTKKGTIIYRVGEGAIRDDGDQLRVSLGADQAAMQAALRMALARYGDRIAVSGSDAFNEQILMAAVAASLPVTFADAALERRHKQLIRSSTAKSGTDESAVGRRPDRGANREPVAPTAREPESSAASFAIPVSHAGLPRRAGAASVPDEGNGAADKYIAEREQKRVNGFDIPKHARYTGLNAGPVTFAGTRRVDSQMLALLKHGDQVMVLEIDDATARSLRRLPLGAQVGVTAQGVIKTKGRRR